MKGVTRYIGPSKLYFQYLLNKIVSLGQLRRPGLRILDFGCGHGMLRKTLPNAAITGYDIIPELSDVSDWRSVEFDVLVANEVFYAMSAADLESLLSELRHKNPILRLVVGISRQGFLNNVGKYLLGRPDAHSATRLRPIAEKEVLLRHCELERSACVFGLADVLVLRFK